MGIVTGHYEPPELHLFDRLPDGFADVPLERLGSILPGPSLIRIAGEQGLAREVLGEVRKAALLAVIDLLHNNTGKNPTTDASTGGIAHR